VGVRRRRGEGVGVEGVREERKVRGVVE